MSRAQFSSIRKLVLLLIVLIIMIPFLYKVGVNTNQSVDVVAGSSIRDINEFEKYLDYCYKKDDCLTLKGVNEDFSIQKDKLNKLLEGKKYTINFKNIEYSIEGGYCYNLEKADTVINILKCED